LDLRKERIAANGAPTKNLEGEVGAEIATTIANRAMTQGTDRNEDAITVVTTHERGTARALGLLRHAGEIVLQVGIVIVIGEAADVMQTRDYLEKIDWHCTLDVWPQVAEQCFFRL